MQDYCATKGLIMNSLISKDADKSLLVDINNTTTEQKESCGLLGLIVDSSLSWTFHIIHHAYKTA